MTPERPEGLILAAMIAFTAYAWGFCRGWVCGERWAERDRPPEYREIVTYPDRKRLRG